MRTKKKQTRNFNYYRFCVKKKKKKCRMELGERHEWKEIYAKRGDHVLGLHLLAAAAIFAFALRKLTPRATFALSAPLPSRRRAYFAGNTRARERERESIIGEHHRGIRIHARAKREDREIYPGWCYKTPCVLESTVILPTPDLRFATFTLLYIYIFARTYV